MSTYVLKHGGTGKYVAAPNSEHAYTSARNQAKEFDSAEEAEQHQCVDCETIYRSSRDTPVVAPYKENP